MTESTQRIQTINPNNLPITEANVVEIINNKPTFDNLPESDRTQILKITVASEYRDELQHKAKIAKLNYADLKATFLANAKSAHTRVAYTLALSRLEMYLSTLGKSFAELTTLDADKFIQSSFLSKPLSKGFLNVAASNRASASIRRDAACVGAFYAFTQRVTDNEVVNPMRGTRALPKKEPSKDIQVPTEKEVNSILASKELPKGIKAAIAIMAFRGLRIGGLPSLNIDYSAQKFSTQSKGKLYNGHLNEAECIGSTPILKYFGTFEGKKKPFSNLDAPKLKMQISYWMKKLQQQGLISTVYSAHDFRHYYSKAFYIQSGNDIYRLQKMLNHSGISITETYLKTLNLI
jgi:site-specific recombinase XerD